MTRPGTIHEEKHNTHKGNHPVQATCVLATPGTQPPTPQALRKCQLHRVIILNLPENDHPFGSENTPQSILVGGKTTPLKNMKVNWDHYSHYMEK
jgi:hypothetical protein